MTVAKDLKNRTGTFGSSEASRNAAYSRIEQGLQVLDAAARALKLEHNSLSLVFRLPPEIVSTIFELVAHGSRDSDVEGGLRWIGISHVCSRWRNIALDCRHLWSYIDILRPRWVMEMLERSKPAPITVVGRAKYRDLKSEGAIAVIAALEQLPRIEELSLTYLNGSFFRVIVSSLTKAAPLLHTLSIAAYYVQTANIALPENMFSECGGAPRLRRLALTKCDLSWHSTFLLPLTDLKICEVSPGCKLSISQLVSLLVDMPQLKHIHLSSVLAPLPNGGVPHLPRKPATLFLTEIHLGEDLANCLAFFTAVSYPETAVVSVECSNPMHATIAPTLRDLITVIDAKNGVPITSLDVGRSTGDSRMQFQGGDSRGITRMSIDLRYVSIDRSELRPLPVNWKALKLQHLKRLQLTNVIIPPSIWFGLFGKLGALRSLTITGYAKVFFDAFASGISRSSPLPPGCVSFHGRLRFKALKFLSINDWHFAASYDGGRYIGKLISFFKERRRRGLTLRTLYLSGVGIWGNELDQLDALIKHVKGYNEDDDSDNENGEGEDENGDTEGVEGNYDQ